MQDINMAGDDGVRQRMSAKDEEIARLKAELEQVKNKDTKAKEEEFPLEAVALQRLKFRFRTMSTIILVLSCVFLVYCAIDCLYYEHWTDDMRYSWDPDFKNFSTAYDQMCGALAFCAGGIVGLGGIIVTNLDPPSLKACSINIWTIRLMMPLVIIYYIAKFVWDYPRWTDTVELTSTQFQIYTASFALTWSFSTDLLLMWAWRWRQHHHPPTAKVHAPTGPPPTCSNAVCDAISGARKAYSNPVEPV